jgi:hypothetical protein
LSSPRLKSSNTARAAPSASPMTTASKKGAHRSGKVLAMIPPNTVFAPRRRQKCESCRARSKSGCRLLMYSRS